MIDARVKFRHLQTFVEVSRQKSVMKAAELLHVSQPAVTKTIRELEEVLGVAVFERDGRGIKITRYGEVFLRHAGAALTALRQGLDSVSQERAGDGGPQGGDGFHGKGSGRCVGIRLPSPDRGGTA